MMATPTVARPATHLDLEAPGWDGIVVVRYVRPTGPAHRAQLAGLRPLADVDAKRNLLVELCDEILTRKSEDELSALIPGQRTRFDERLAAWLEEDGGDPDAVLSLLGSSDGVAAHAAAVTTWLGQR